MTLFELSTVQGKIIILITIRVLQRQLNKVSQENLFKLLHKLCGHFKELMIDTYGNYFSQKLFQCCTFEQRILIINSVFKIY